MQKIDLESVINIEQQVQYHPWTKNQFIDSLQSYQCTVIENYQRVVGFCIMQPVLDEANLLLMAIDPEFQGQGLGFTLLEAAINRLGEKCSQIFLEVRESNQAAIKLYEKTGFHQIDMRKNYYPTANHKKEHAIIMVNMLNANIFQFSS